MDAEPSTCPPYVVIGTSEEVPEALAALRLFRTYPVLVLAGGAAGLGRRTRAGVADVLRDRVVPVLERRQAAAVDLGADTGLTHLFGLARLACHARFPLVGVVAAGTVRLPYPVPDPGADRPGLGPGHSGVLVVPDDDEDAEGAWLAGIAGHLAGRRPSVTLVVDGGDAVHQDVAISLALARPVLVLSGTGAGTDALAGAAGRGGVVTGRAVRACTSPLVTVLPVEDGTGLEVALDAVLAAGAWT